MKPIEQREPYDAEQGLTGDCWKCCLASILELPYEAVPHFVQLQEDGEIESYWNASLAFLRERGLTLTRFGLWGKENPYLLHGSKRIRYFFSAPGHWIASVHSPRYDGEHVVVMRGSSIA